jgi:hypothetical protein
MARPNDLGESSPAAPVSASRRVEESAAWTTALLDISRRSRRLPQTEHLGISEAAAEKLLNQYSTLDPQSLHSYS